MLQTRDKGFMRRCKQLIIKEQYVYFETHDEWRYKTDSCYKWVWLRIEYPNYPDFMESGKLPISNIPDRPNGKGSSHIYSAVFRFIKQEFGHQVLENKLGENTRSWITLYLFSKLLVKTFSHSHVA